jgi:hypothetical protein
MLILMMRHLQDVNGAHVGSPAAVVVNEVEAFRVIRHFSGLVS